MIFNIEDILTETEFSTSLSGGPGGQHVNKTETKVNLHWKFKESKFINEDEKHRILKRLKNRINKSDELRLSCSDTRSQHQNKKILVQRFQNLLSSSLEKTKNRKRTQVPKRIKQKRLERKAKNAEKKKLRRKPNY